MQHRDSDAAGVRRQAPRDSALDGVLDMERSIVGLLITDPPDADRAPAIDLAGSLLTVEDFSLEAHRLVVRALIGMHERGDHVGLATLRADLEKRGDLEAAGGAAALTGLAALACHYTHLEPYARLVHEAARRRKLERFGFDLAQRAADPTEDMAALLADLDAERVALEPRGDWRFTSAAVGAGDLLAADIPAPRSLLGDGVLTAGGFGIIFGAPGGGKTWLGLKLALAWARGEAWCGLATPPEGVRVGLLELELGGHAVQRRLRALGVTAGDDRLRVLCRPRLRGAVDLLRAGDMAALREWIKRERLDVVLIDALSRAHTANENKAEELGALLAALDALRFEAGCAVLLLHHERKAANGGHEDSDLDALRGHSRLQSDPTLLARLKVMAGGLRCLRFAKVTEGPTPEPVWFRLGDDGTPTVVESPSGVADRSRERVLEALRNAPSGLSSGELAAASGISRATAHRHVTALVEAGSVEVSGANRATRYHLSTVSPSHPSHGDPRDGGGTRMHNELDECSGSTVSRTVSGTDGAPSHRLTVSPLRGGETGETVKASPVPLPHGPGGEPEPDRKWTDGEAVAALRELIDGEPVLAVTLRPLAAPRTADA
jgi:hypothetical protein